MTIKIGTTIKKLNPNDAYPIVELSSVGGLETRLSTIETEQTDLQSQIDTKIVGVRVGDSDGNTFNPVDNIILNSATVSDYVDKSITITTKPKVNVSYDSGTPSINNVETIEFPQATVTTRDSGKVAVIYPKETHATVRKFGETPFTDITNFVLTGNVEVAQTAGDPGSVDIAVATPLGRTSRFEYLTSTVSDLKQTLVANNTPETVMFNVTDYISPKITADLTNGVFTNIAANDAMFTVSLQVIREVGGNVDVNWTVFVETSLDGVSWTPVNGTARRTTFTSANTNELRVLDLTIAVRLAVGEKFRLRHVTTDASKGISIISKAATSGAPSSAGAMLSVFTVT